MPHPSVGVIPEPAFTYLALIVSSLTIGYWVGLGRSLGYTRGNAAPLRPADTDSDDTEPDSHDETDLKSVQPIWSEESKLTLLRIYDGISHATLACYKALRRANPSLLRHWERSGQAKIALKLQKSECGTEEDEMLLLKAKARSLGLCAQDICDAGRTQIAAGSRTVLGIGPGPVGLINQVTRHLKLL
ncbi:peptidyl-tRNA hydrolase [Puccinia sorghi]|uniref:peptidyl-tRNA hydrolase n=1 Tax=Puccinia sorghi TaxID=27349 RepID=A0A0L6VW03_9BASI|nr:peptidyl-tRNA hydrolase [Puccinia sorghi]